jgi:hypothetical protein
MGHPGRSGQSDDLPFADRLRSDRCTRRAGSARRGFGLGLHRAHGPGVVALHDQPAGAACPTALDRIEYEHEHEYEMTALPIAW